MKTSEAKAIEHIAAQIKEVEAEIAVKQETLEFIKNMNCLVSEIREVVRRKYGS